MKFSVSLVGFVVLAGVGFAQVFPPDFPQQEPSIGDNPQSSTALTDGTPQATTAVVARESAGFALPTDPAKLEAEFPELAAAGEPAAPAKNDTGVDVGYGSFKIAGVKGDSWTARVPYSRRLDDRATLEIGVPLTLTTIKQAVGGDAQIYGMGVNVGYSYGVVTKLDSKNYRWRLTPNASLTFRNSSDLNMGSGVLGAGISSSFAWQIAPRWVFNIGNSLTATYATSTGGHPDPTRKNQFAVVNGAQLARLMGRWSLNAFVMDTRFVRDVLVDGYQTYAVGLGYKVTQYRSFRVLGVVENGAGYRSWNITAANTWRF